MVPTRFKIALAALAAAGLACSLFGGPVTPAPTAPAGSGPRADYGDAPDPAFPSLFTSDGARTLDITQFWLGNLDNPSATSEPDAKIIDSDELDDGLEEFVFTGTGIALVFRAVKSSTAEDGSVYFNLLVDTNGDGVWGGASEWAVVNREVYLPPGASELINAPLPATDFYEVWIRATVTDAPVDLAAFPGGWDGTGQFAQGEVEDYRLPRPDAPPTETPTVTPTPTETPTGTPTERVITSLPPTLTFTPTKFAFTGDFVIECSPPEDAIEHGGSIRIGLHLVSGAHTPPDRFRVFAQAGDAAPGTVAITLDPPAGADGWAPWKDGAGFTVRSLAVDPPERIEEVIVTLQLQSRSTTRYLQCKVYVVHRDATPTPTATPTATATARPPVKTPSIVPSSQQVSLGSTVYFSGSGFTPNGPLTKTFTRPDGYSFGYELNADANGNMTGSLYLSTDQPTGSWAVTVVDQTSGQQTRTTFTVVP